MQRKQWTPRYLQGLIRLCCLQVQGSLESSLMSASTPRYLSNLPLNLPSPVTPLLPVSGGTPLLPTRVLSYQHGTERQKEERYLKFQDPCKCN